MSRLNAQGILPECIVQPESTLLGCSTLHGRKMVRRLRGMQRMFLRGCACFQRRSDCRRSVSSHRAGRTLRHSCG